MLFEEIGKSCLSTYYVQSNMYAMLRALQRTLEQHRFEHGSIYMWIGFNQHAVGLPYSWVSSVDSTICGSKSVFSICG